MCLRQPVPRAKWHSTNDERIRRDRCYFVFTVKPESDLSVCSTCSKMVTVALIFADCGTPKLESIESDQHSSYFSGMKFVHDGAVIYDEKELLLLSRCISVKSPGKFVIHFRMFCVKECCQDVSVQHMSHGTACCILSVISSISNL